MRIFLFLFLSLSAHACLNQISVLDVQARRACGVANTVNGVTDWSQCARYTTLKCAPLGGDCQCYDGYDFASVTETKLNGQWVLATDGTKQALADAAVAAAKNDDALRMQAKQNVINAEFQRLKAAQQAQTK